MWSRKQAYGGIQSHLCALKDAIAEIGGNAYTWVLPSRSIVHAPQPHDEARLSEESLEAELDQLIDELNIEVLHAHNLHIECAPLVPAKVARVARHHRIPLVVTMHDLGPFRSGAFHPVRVIEQMPNACFVVTSPHNRRLFLEAFRFPPAAVVPPGIDFTKFNPSTTMPERNTITCPGRLTRGKGLLRAIQVLRLASETLGPIQLFISEPNRSCVGENPMFLQAIRNAQNQCPALSISFFSGSEHISSLYLGSLITLALPTIPEGFGLVPLESLASGRPVIATPTGGMWWLKDSKAAKVFKTFEPREVAEAVISMLRKWPAWHAAALKEIPILREKYDIRAIRDAYLRIYEEAKVR